MKFTELGSGEPSAEQFIKKVPTTMGDQASVWREDSDTTEMRRKKAPSDLCDLKALIAHLKAKPSFEFYYMVWAVPLWSEFYNPYCLK